MNTTTKTVFSKRWNLLKLEVKKIFKGFLLGLAGAVCAYLEVNFIGDFKIIVESYVTPEFIPLILGLTVAVNSSIINTIHKLLTNTTYIDHK